MRILFPLPEDSRALTTSTAPARTSTKKVERSPLHTTSMPTRGLMNEAYSTMLRSSNVEKPRKPVLQPCAFSSNSSAWDLLQKFGQPACPQPGTLIGTASWSSSIGSDIVLPVTL